MNMSLFLVMPTMIVTWQRTECCFRSNAGLIQCQNMYAFFSNINCTICFTAHLYPINCTCRQLLWLECYLWLQFMDTWTGQAKLCDEMKVMFYGYLVPAKLLQKQVLWYCECSLLPVGILQSQYPWFEQVVVVEWHFNRWNSICTTANLNKSSLFHESKGLSLR